MSKQRLVENYVLDQSVCEMLPDTKTLSGFKQYRSRHTMASVTIISFRLQYVHFSNRAFPELQVLCSSGPKELDPRKSQLREDFALLPVQLTNLQTSLLHYCPSIRQPGALSLEAEQGTHNSLSPSLST